MLVAVTLSTPFLIIAWVALVAACVIAVIYAKRAHVIRERLRSEHEAQFEEIIGTADESMGRVQRWLFLAGFRQPGAPAAFMAISFGTFVSGLVLALTISQSAALFQARVWLYQMPGNIGVLLDPVLQALPWFLFVVLTIAPWLHVRSARRKRVKTIEEDLPITLQLLATLARAGLGLDAALIRVLESSDTDRPLAQEFVSFRRENLAGLTRADCWRRLAQRVDVSSVSMLVSAMLHAEQVGGGISSVLEHQTQDVQSRRRERALIASQTIQVKLVFPLVLCFLPGIFVWPLGPAFYQFLKVLDGIMRGVGPTSGL